MNNEMSHEDGDELLARVTGGDASACHDLLNAFFAGYPVPRLAALLHSESDETVRVGAWLASELGAAAAPLLGDLAHLLHHRAKYVRFFALDAVLAAATSVDGTAVACALMRISDSEAAVRWKAMYFLAAATKSQLEAGLVHLTDESVAAAIRWLLRCDDAADAGNRIVSMLDESDPLLRRVAAVAARRVYARNSAPLLQTALSSDPDLRAFAESQVRVLAS